MIIDKYYISAKETQNFTIDGNAFFSFTINFKYLGSWISYDFNDSFDVYSKIKKGN